MFENSLWLFVVAGGPLILAAVVAYALLTRRRRGPAEKQQTAQATARLYREKEPDQ
jgi:hypothetical protein